MNKDETKDWAKRTLKAVRDANHWADEQLELKAPFSDRSMEVLVELRKTVHRLKAMVQKLRVEAESGDEPSDSPPR